MCVYAYTHTHTHTYLHATTHTHRKLVANREIAFVSKQQSLTKTDPSVKSYRA